RTETIGEARAAHERREARVEPGQRPIDDRQQLAVAPQILGPPFDLFPRQPDRRVVVHGLERTEAPIADVQRLGGKHGLAHVALQSEKGAHTTSINPSFHVRRSKFETRGSTFDAARPAMARGLVKTGAGTIAARSRAIATRSPRIATAVASPPAPAP